MLAGTMIRDLVPPSASRRRVGRWKVTVSPVKTLGPRLAMTSPLKRTRSTRDSSSDAKIVACLHVTLRSSRVIRTSPVTV
ncbi:hypothetical protein D3C86_2068730 [compost metagenome]